MTTHGSPDRSSSPPTKPTDRPPSRHHRLAHTPSYSPGASYLYKDPSIIQGGTAPVLVAQPGMLPPQYYTTSATRPLAPPTWGAPVYIQPGSFYASPVYPPPQQYQTSSSPRPSATARGAEQPISWGSGYHSGPIPVYPQPTVYHQPAYSPPPQRPSGSARRRSSLKTPTLTRPKTTSGDHEDNHDVLIGKWTVGEDYAPVLNPFIASLVQPEFTLNPILAPHSKAQESQSNTTITWNIIYPGSYARLPGDPSGESWFEKRTGPATFPRMSSISIISPAFPWTIDIKAEGEGTAVTCRDVVDQVHKYLCVLLSPLEMDDVTPEHRKAMSAAFRANRSQDIPAETFQNSHGMRRIDWLCKNTIFEGLEEDKEYITERLAVFIPSTFVLRCSQKSSSMKLSTTQRRLHISKSPSRPTTPGPIES